MRRVLAATLITRAAVFAAGLVAIATIGHAPNMGPPPPSELAYLPARWDASWYIGVANGGYRWEGPGHHNSRLAFFPAFPMTLRAVARALRLPPREPPWLWTGVILSTAIFFLALLYLRKLAALWFGAAEADRAVLVAAAYPFALFFGQVYSEGLFLLAAVASTYHLARAQAGRAAAWGLIAGLTRPIGCLVSFVLAGAFVAARRSGKPPRAVSALIAIASPCLGTLAYSAYVRWLTGHWFTWITDQAGWGRPTVNPITLVGEIAAYVRDHGAIGYLADRPFEAINLAALVAALLFVVPIARRVNVGAALFVLLSVAAPLRVGGLASMGRYTAVLFPIYLWLGTALKGRTAAIVIGIFAVLQLLLAAMFFTDRSVY